MSITGKGDMKEFLFDRYERWGGAEVLSFTFDLQLFASPEDEGRTEDPSEKKLREAREKGQVVKTQELSQSAVVIFGFLILYVFGSWIYESLFSMTRHYLSSFSRVNITEKSIHLEFIKIIFEGGKLLLPLFVGACLAAILGNIVQVGFQISTHPLKFDLGKIKFDPATVMKKLFFSKQVAMNLFKTIFKVAAIGLISYLIIMDDFEKILLLSDISISAALKTMMLSGLKIIIWASVLLLILSIPDYIFQRREFMDSLKMTKTEVKEELKETMGDPYLRARLREMQREIVMKNMIREVPNADVVVTNPTHFSIALRYEKATMEAPTVIAKGVDSMALKIRQIAKDNNIAIIQNRPLAQELYKRVNVGDIIPEDLFYTVVLVYKELYERGRFSEAI